MFSITRDAASELSSMLEQMDASESNCLRLEVQGNQAVLRMDRPRADDHVFQFDGRNVLVADSATLEACAGICLDYDNKNDSSFVFTHGMYELN